MKVLPDAFHMNIEEIDILKTIDTFLPFFGAFHCADSNRLAPGMGHLDFPLIIDHLKGGDLRYLGVEVLPLPDSETAASQAVKTLREALRASEK